MVDRPGPLAGAPSWTERAVRSPLRSALDVLVETHAAGRFLSAPMAVAVGFYGVLTVTFAHFVVTNDALVYYDFLRRLLGADVVTSYSRGFGSALFDLPFYLAARAIDLATGLSSAFGASLGEVSVTAATMVALVLTLYLGWRVLVELELPAGPAVLLLALFGSPLFYYAVFQTTYKHAVDALGFTLVAFLLLRTLRRPKAWTLLALGASLAFLVAIRPANVTLVPGVLVALLLKRELRAGGLVVVATVAFTALLFAIPRARGIPRHPVEIEKKALVAPRPLAGAIPQAAGVLALYGGICKNPGYHLTFWQCVHNGLGLWWSPSAPAKMLFSVRRGIFLWTPLTAFATLGAALLLFSRPERRPFVAGLWVCAVGLLLAHWFWADFWTGGFSFSQRFLASLFPFYLVGTAELLRRRRAAALAVLTACAAFSLFLGFEHYVGYRGNSAQDGLGTVFESYTTGERTPVDLARNVGFRALDRWGFR